MLYVKLNWKNNFVKARRDAINPIKNAYLLCHLKATYLGWMDDIRYNKNRLITK